MAITKNKIKWKWALYIYALILCSANFLRIFDNVFWLDEGFTIRLVRMNIPQMLAATAADVHPPLFYLWGQLLYFLFGDTGCTYHLTAFIPYIVLIFFSCVCIRRDFGTIPAFVFVTLLSVMQNSLIYLIEARMYELAALFVVLAFYCLYKIIEDNHISAWVMFCIFSLGAAYTHYYALISVAFFYLYLFIWALKDRKNMRRFVSITAVSIFGYAPWLGVLLDSFEGISHGWWLTTIPTAKNCISFVFAYKWLLGVFIIAVSLFCLYQCGIICVGGEDKKIKIESEKLFEIFKNKEVQWVLAGLLSLLGTMAVGLLVSYVYSPVFIPRYLYPVSVAAYLILGVCISRLHFKRLWTIILVAVILGSNVPVYYETYRDEQQLNYEVEQFLEMVTPSSDAIIYTDQTQLTTLLEYYYPENRYVLVMDFSEVPSRPEENEIWLFWSQRLDMVEADVEAALYGYEEFYSGRFAGGDPCYVYRMAKNTAGELNQ